MSGWAEHANFGGYYHIAGNGSEIRKKSIIPVTATDASTTAVSNTEETGKEAMRRFDLNTTEVLPSLENYCTVSFTEHSFGRTLLAPGYPCTTWVHLY